MNADHVARLRALISDGRAVDQRYFQKLADSATEPPRFGDDQTDDDRAEIDRLYRAGVIQTMHLRENPPAADDIARLAKLADEVAP